MASHGPFKNHSVDSNCNSEKPSAEMTRSASTSTRSGSFVDAVEPTRSHDDNAAVASLAAPPEEDHESPRTFWDMWPKERQAYVCLVGGFLQMFVSWGYVNAFGTYASYYHSHLLPDADNLLINLIGSTESFWILVLSFVVGRLVDAGHIRYILCAGTVFLALGTFLLSIANGPGGYGDGNYGLIWTTQAFLTGLGMACHFVSSSQVVSTWFIDTKSFAVGFVACGASAGGAVISTMARFLHQQLGFNNASRCVAALVTLMSLLTIFMCVPNPHHIKNKTAKWRWSTFWDASAFHEPCFNWLTAAIFFLFLGFYAVFFNLEEWAAFKGLGYRENTRPDGISPNAVQTFALLSIMNGSSFVGRLVSAAISDHLGVYGALHVHAFVTLVSSVLLMAFWTTANTVGAAMAFVTLFGMFSGAVIGLPAASMAFVIGKRDKVAQAKLGQRVGMMYTVASLSAFTGPLIAGHLITESGTFLTVQLWTGGCLLVSTACMCVCMYYERRQRQRRLSSATIEHMNSIDSAGGILERLRRKEG